MKKLNKILVPVPISEEGEIALKQAEYFRKILNLDITVLHIVPTKSFISKHFKGKKENAPGEAVISELEDFICGFYDGKMPEHVQIKMKQGDLVETIVEYSHEKEYDLIIIKKAKRKENKIGLFNQNDADKIIAGSYCPVITINEHWNESGIKTILLPVDIFQRSDKKVNWALFIAKKFDAKIHLVSALHAPVDKEDSIAYKKAESIKEYYNEHGVECEIDIFSVYKKKHYEAVLEVINKVNPDLVMIMTHKEIFSFDRTIGSFATEIIHQATMPIFSFVPGSDTVFNYLIRIMDSNK